jgi:FdhD protein
MSGNRGFGAGGGATATPREPGVAGVTVARVTGVVVATTTDELSVEEPLEIRIAAGADGRTPPTPVAVTMRTPGDDADLAAGFLYTEGIIASRTDLEDLEIETPNVVTAHLPHGLSFNPSALERHSFVSSSCGVCGKRSIAAVTVARRHRIPPREPRITPQVVHTLSDALRAGQPGFARTGGLHAAALFDAGGRLLALREDVGRHNALDKLIGAELRANRVPLTSRLVFVSGRLSFELVQKAALAGVPVLVAVGAPSSLAVELARESGMTLLGFVRDGRFNVYSDFGRLKVQDTVSWSRPR